MIHRIRLDLSKDIIDTMIDNDEHWYLWADGCVILIRYAIQGDC